MTRLFIAIGVLLSLFVCILAKTSSSTSPDSSLKSPSYKYLIIRDDCVEPFFDLDLTNPKIMDCAVASIRKGLGYGIIAGSTVVKLPQVIKILQDASVAGLSLMSSYMELVSNLLTTVWHIWYGSSFDKYGETVIVGFGTMAVIACIWYYAFPGKAHVALVFVFLTALLQLAFTTPDVVAAFLQEHFPFAKATINGQMIQDSLISITGIIFSVARLFQIGTVIKGRTVGSLSGITAFMNFAGTAARVFTSADLADPVQYSISVASAFLNLVILALFFIFPPVKAKEKSS